MSGEVATDDARQRWATIRDKVFGAQELSDKEKAAAWKQLRQHDLQFVEGLLDVTSQQLTAVLRNEIPGECWQCAALTVGNLVAWLMR